MAHLNDDPINNMNAKQLKQYCRSNKISGYSGLTKKQIVDLIVQGKIDKKAFIFNKEDLKDAKKIQCKKLSELKLICKQLNISIYKKSKQKLIASILKLNQEKNDEILVKFYATDSGDEFSPDKNTDIEVSSDES